VLSSQQVCVSSQEKSGSGQWILSLYLLKRKGRCLHLEEGVVEREEEVDEEGKEDKEDEEEEEEEEEMEEEEEESRDGRELEWEDLREI